MSLNNDKREQFDELKAMIQTLAMCVQNSTAVSEMGKEVKTEFTNMGEDVKKVTKKLI